jgi:hypothetical protein
MADGRHPFGVRRTALATINDDPPPARSRVWSLISATLISGERDAFLVDPLLAHRPGTRPRRLVAVTGKNLMADLMAVVGRPAGLRSPPGGARALLHSQVPRPVGRREHDRRQQVWLPSRPRLVAPPGHDGAGRPPAGTAATTTTTTS